MGTIVVTAHDPQQVLFQRKSVVWRKHFNPSQIFYRPVVGVPCGLGGPVRGEPCDNVDASRPFLSLWFSDILSS
jgi:hypothetical protein